MTTSKISLKGPIRVRRNPKRLLLKWETYHYERVQVIGLSDDSSAVNLIVNSRHMTSSSANSALVRLNAKRELSSYHMMNLVDIISPSLRKHHSRK